MNKLIKLLKKIDDNILPLLLCFFIFLIPLYPKVPLVGVTFTYISIRLEDFYIALITGVFIIQLVRKKITLNRTFLIPFIVFWTILFISYFWGYLYSSLANILWSIRLYRWSYKCIYLQFNC